MSPGNFTDKKTINIAGKWTVLKVRTGDPRGSQNIWSGRILADQNVCITVKQTLNKDHSLEGIFDNILSTAKVND